MDEENLRLLIDQAIHWGQSRQSPCTGFLHYSDQEELSFHQIPLVENFLFALALLRSRLSENVLEAKELLQRLLAFQIKVGEEKGGFPIYIHEFPLCKDRWLSLQILPSIYWILKDFDKVLGNDLSISLTTASVELIDQMRRAWQIKSPSYLCGVRVGAILMAFGRLFQRSEWEQEGYELLEKYAKIKERSVWHSPSAIGELLVALQMAYSKKEDGHDEADYLSSFNQWNDFLQFIQTSWYSPTGSFIGGTFKEIQRGFEPQATLYDLLMGYWEGEFSSRALQSGRHFLQGVWIPPKGNEVVQIFHQKESSQAFPNWSIALLNKEIDFPTKPEEKWFHFFQLLWGDKKSVNSFVGQGTTAERVSSCLISENNVEINFEFNSPSPGEEKEKNREISFYLNRNTGAKILVEGVPSTTFQLGQMVSIEIAQLKFSIQFSLEQGEGSFIGHIAMANRPAQISTDRFEVYDWQISLRTLHRSNNCCIKVRVFIH